MRDGPRPQQFPSICMPVCLQTEFLGEMKTQPRLPQEGNLPQTKVRIVLTCSLVNRRAFAGVTNKSMGDGLHTGPLQSSSITKKTTLTLVTAHISCNLGALCTTCQGLHWSEKSLCSSATWSVSPTPQSPAVRNPIYFSSLRHMMVSRPSFLCSHIPPGQNFLFASLLTLNSLWSQGQL